MGVFAIEHSYSIFELTEKIIDLPYTAATPSAFQ